MKTMLHLQNCQRTRARRQLGLSLVEMMIALTIGLILLAGITALIVEQSNSRDELEKSSRQIENGRYAMQILHDDIQHAGFYGKYYTLAAATTMVDPCSTALSDIGTALPIPIQGYNNALPTASFSCALDGVNSSNNAANYVSGTDILVIRRTATMTTAIASAVAGQVYLQSTSSAYVLGTGSDTSVFNLMAKTGGSASTPAELRAFNTHIYFISPCSIPANGGASCTGSGDDNGHPLPTLKRLDLTTSGGATTFKITPLVEGIENLQLDYGVDTDNDGAPDTTSLPTTAVGWSNVMAIRVSLLARNPECTTGYTDNKTYRLGATTVTPPASDCTNGGYKRHVYTALVRTVNPSGRRE